MTTFGDGLIDSIDDGVLFEAGEGYTVLEYDEVETEEGEEVFKWVEESDIEVIDDEE